MHPASPHTECMLLGYDDRVGCFAANFDTRNVHVIGVSELLGLG